MSPSEPVLRRSELQRRLPCASIRCPQSFPQRPSAKYEVSPFERIQRMPSKVNLACTGRVAQLRSVWVHRLLGAAGISVLALAVPTVGHAQISPVVSCTSVAKLALPQATITAAETVGAGTYKLPESGLTRLTSASGMNIAGHVKDDPNPAFCRIAATLKPSSASDIKVEVWLPLKGWNGKFIGVGNFGWAGSFMLS